MRNTKVIGTYAVSKVVRPKGQKLFRQRTTNRYGKPKGTFSPNQGYLTVLHGSDGRFKSAKIA